MSSLCEREREHSFSAVHVNRHLCSDSVTRVCDVLDDASRMTPTGRESHKSLTGITALHLNTQTHPLLGASDFQWVQKRKIRCRHQTDLKWISNILMVIPPSQYDVPLFNHNIEYAMLESHIQRILKIHQFHHLKSHK